MDGYLFASFVCLCLVTSYYDKVSITSWLLMKLDEYMYHLDNNLLLSVSFRRIWCSRLTKLCCCSDVRFMFCRISCGCRAVSCTHMYPFNLSW